MCWRVYFGSVGIKRVRHAVAGGLVADLGGFVAAVLAAYLCSLAHEPEAREPTMGKTQQAHQPPRMMARACRPLPILRTNA